MKSLHINCLLFFPSLQCVCRPNSYPANSCYTCVGWVSCRVCFYECIHPLACARLADTILVSLCSAKCRILFGALVLLLLVSPSSWINLCTFLLSHLPITITLVFIPSPLFLALIHLRVWLFLPIPLSFCLQDRLYWSSSMSPKFFISSSKWLPKMLLVMLLVRTEHWTGLVDSTHLILLPLRGVDRQQPLPKQSWNLWLSDLESLIQWGRVLLTLATA